LKISNHDVHHSSVANLRSSYIVADNGSSDPKDSKKNYQQKETPNYNGNGSSYGNVFIGT
jgi:hypothetical protein